MSEDDLIGAACHIDHPLYVVTPRGRVFSFVFSRPRELKGGMVGRYRGCALKKRDWSNVSWYVHRLVAEVFHGSPKKGHEVRHLDGNCLNNAASNLAWGTRSENMQDKTRHGTQLWGERHPQAKFSEKHIALMRRLSKTAVPVHMILKYFGVSRMQHWRIVNNKAWSHIQ